jgi:hypothetical protein
VSDTKVWELPEWAPKDAGSILIRDGDWILIKDYKVHDHSPMATAVHLCDGGPWIPFQSPPGPIDGKCSACQDTPPAAFLGFWQLARWDR